ncbi:hypothetical protein D8674_017532 [Pyrus ussuriensis x Pyrus communis]|uniref:Splicing factor 3A subunit 1 n=1 Tax=Pyrus ussuriensis x Pyrus communis TaxID=2448454 RepID=A0A5N5HIC2_9ROSA|nr:hypothetical protein D8674_017532 [Pyrus ussuriensis x Pyrus communis]
MIGSILPLPAPPFDGDLGPRPESQVTELNQDEKQLDEELSKANSTSVATHTRAIGIIHPPSDIRNIVDKTAQFVANNGPEFGKRIMANNTGNAKFSFLISTDPYHAYYQHRLSEFRPADSASPESAPPGPAVDGEAGAPMPDFSAQFRPEFTVRLPEGITGEELDIIKLTAQFAARNRKTFLQGLTSREMNNHQFHFLKPMHSMFTFFTSLADAYSKVLMPPENLPDKLKKSVADMTTVLERCVHRLGWERSQEQARQKAEDEIEQERIQMAMIDWHDFVVVETIDFADDEDEDLPPPMTLEEVIRRSKNADMEEDVEPGKVVEMEMDEEEMQLVEEGLRTSRLEENDDEKKNENVVTEDPKPPMRIVKNWKRPKDRIPAERDPTKHVISPIIGELILINEMSEHMRISLIDPKYKEQKERMFAKIRETTLAQDDEISRNIEEVSNAVKAEIEKKKDEQPKQVIWDGHTGSIGRTANQAMSQNINGEDQNDGLNNDARNVPGPAAPPPRPGVPSIRPLPPPPVQYSAPPSGSLPAPPPRPPVVQYQSIRPPGPPMPMSSGQHSVPPPPGSQFTPMQVSRPYMPLPVPPPTMQMMPAPPLPQGEPPPPPEEAPPPLPEEPEPKRQKLDDSMLISEDQFLAQHPGPVRITVSVPNVDEGNLKGQLLEITVQSLSETVGSSKEKISGEIQLPANKQKLSGKPGFFKDNMSLAFYNVGAGETLTLSLREHGGGKR